MAYAALVSLAQTLDQILDHGSYYINSPHEEEQIISVKKHVILLQAFLESFPDNADKLEGRIRDVANQAEDIMEDFMLVRIRLRRSRFGYIHHFWNEIHPHWAQLRYHLEKATEKIESIAEQVEQVMNINNSFRIKDKQQLYDPPGAASSSEVAPTHKDVMIGFDDDLTAIKAQLCGESCQLRVIPIFGMGGIGKTTLARNAYEDPLVMEYFHIRAWVTISQDYSAQEILSSLLVSMEGFNEERSGQSNEEKVYTSLKGRRYLVVLDDMWSTKAWDEVRNIFPNDDVGSRIMLTTRLSDVAAYPDLCSSIYEIRFMDEDQSWKLLRNKVFARQDCPLELEDIGKEIARSCKGLPLAIVVIAGLLSTVSKNPASWREIAENVNSVVAAKDGQFEEILSLSYTHLPHHLRPCFLYMGGFPEDHEVRVSKLLKLWVGEGFLKHPNGSKSLEEEAEECLEDLVKRSLVLVTKRKSNGKIKSCSLHGLMRDLCIRKAHEENFLVNVRDGYVGKELLINPRRMSIAFIGPIPDLSKTNGSTIHTIMWFLYTSLPSVESARLLRVLDAGDADVHSLPAQLFELFHLRYLAINYCYMIPAAISRLQNLQTLIIRARGQWKVDAALEDCLPHEIWMMPQLRHLFFYGRLPNPTQTASTLENLQTLLFSVSSGTCTEGILEMVPNLKKLEITHDRDGDFDFNSLVRLHQLETLQLHSHNIRPLWRPDNFTFPRMLRKLTLSSFGLLWDEMMTVCSLPNLQVLKLRDFACRGSIWETTDGNFPKLEFLLIEKSYLEDWITEACHFPRLKFLLIHDCWRLREIPNGIGEILTLELIEIKGHVKKSLMESAKQIQEVQQSWGDGALHIRCMTHYGPVAGPEEVVHALDCQLSAPKQAKKGFLEDFPDNAKNLEERMRDAANDAENNIEHLMSVQTRSDQAQLGDHFHELEKVTQEIESIAEQVISIKNSSGISKKPQLCHSPGTASSSRFAPIHKDVMVGFDDDLTKIKDQVCGLSSKLEVIPIFGMGGIGKTTLAGNAYDDSLIVEHFHIRAWVTVSQDYSAHEILSGLLTSMKVPSEGIFGQNSIDLMAEKVYKSLKGRRYLIVLDDMWSTKVWDDLKMLFPDDRNGSRIMLTTRVSDVAAYPDPCSPLHEMCLMDEDKSWNLLRQKAFADQDCPLELENIGKEIARSCGGLPLAIVVIAGVLSTVTKTPASWGEIAENVNSVVAAKGEHLEKILSLSYNHLPHNLRPCFLYMGGFPEDHEIRISKLIKLWVAEGFLKRPNGSKSLEEKAEDCVEDLVKRSLVLVTKRKSNGKIKSCSLHDLMRDLCIRKAHENKFLLNLMDRYVGKELSVKGIRNQRRISIASYGPLYLLNIYGSTIRTILCFHGISVLDSLKSFRLLRVLDAGDAYVESLPAQLFELFHLRYLAVNYDDMIPAAISNLRNLQTLILTGWSQCLPQEIWRMPQLRHLLFYGRLPDPEGATSVLENLHTLSSRSHDMCTEGILKLIPNLKKLEIHCSGFQVCTYLNNLVCLHQLEIFKLHSVYGIDWQKDDFSFPKMLKKLTLSGLRLPWIEMMIVGSLPNLRVLKLRDYACVGSTWETTEGEFPQLEFLLIEISDLEYWITEKSHFSRLKCLVLDECRQLSEIPDGVGEISTLELIEVKGKAEKSLVESARRIQEEQRSWGNDAFQVRCMTY